MPHRNAPSAPTFRPFHPDDADAVQTLILSILESELRDLPKEHHLWEIENLGDRYKDPSSECFLAEQDGRIIGVLGVLRDEPGAALMERFFVNPHFRGKAVGKTLLKKAIEFCKDQGYQKLVFLGHEHMKEAKAMLGKVGFKEEVAVGRPGSELFRLTLKI